MGSISIAASSAILLLLLLLLLLPLLMMMMMTPHLPSSSANQSNNKVRPLLVNFKTEWPLLQLLMLIASPSSSSAAAAAAVVTIWLMRSWAKGKKEGFNLLQQQNDNNNNNNSRLPPGRQGMPVIGETLKLIAAYKTEDPEPFIDERVKRNGSRLFTSHVFGERTVFSADHEFNRLVVGGEGKTFECSYPSSISTLLGKHSLVLMKGSLHKRMHSLTLTRFSSLSVLRRALLPDIDRLVSTTLDSWSAGAGRPLLLLDQAKKITFQLTVKQLMSCDPGEWTEALRREYLLLIDGFFSIPFPSFLSFTTYGRAIQARMKVAEKLRGVVRKRKEERKRNGGEGINDMLDELMEAEEGFSEEEMVDFLLALLVAGYETTPTIMTLVVKFLTDNPSALSLLKEEHVDIRAKKKHKSNPLEWSDYKDMRFTQCVINETLRVANIVSGVFRRATSDIHFKGYRIPKGCKVFASFRAVHMDPENFKDARTFNPWRWQTRCENGVFTPFGGGPRLCPGYELARLEISIFIHHLVTRFSWDMAEQDSLIFFPTTRLVKGYPITVHRREVSDTHIHI